MDKEGSKDLSNSVFSVKVEEMPLEFSVKIEPETFQFETTEKVQRSEIVLKEEPMGLDEFPIKKEPREDLQFEETETFEQQEKLDGSNGEESCRPLEFDIKLEPQRFYYPMPSQKPRRILKAEPNFLKSVEKITQATSQFKAVTRVGKFHGNQWIGSPRRLMHKGPYSCDICGTICKSRGSMYHHMKNNHTSHHIFCDLCPKSFKTKSRLSYHIKSHMKFKALVCDVCEFSTKYKETLRRHKLTHGKKTECPICNKLVNVLKDHMRSVHKKVPCKICGMKTRRGNLKDHVRIVHEKNNRCTHDKCNEVFGTKLELNRHVLRAHYDGKLFECHCGSVFKSSKDLSSHKSKNHKSETVICKDCYLTFKSRSALIKHWNQKHCERHGRLVSSKFRS